MFSAFHPANRELARTWPFGGLLAASTFAQEAPYPDVASALVEAPRWGIFPIAKLMPPSDSSIKPRCYGLTLR